jgi:hypothetical protein
MHAVHIDFPANLTTESALRFGEQLRQLPIAAMYEINFERCRWIEPFSALIASSEIARLKKRVHNRPIKVLNHTHMSYAAHIGFFQSFGFNYGNLPGEAPGSPTYQPIQILLTDQVRRFATSENLAVGAVMERYADKLAAVLCRSNEGNVYETLSYSLREIMRNVVEHSDADRIGFCAQYWPVKQRVEVAVMDWGVGIRKGLQQNPKLQPTCDSDAIQLALMPGVSGKGERVKRLRNKDQWTNSGYGLYMTSRLCRNGGTFFLGSGDHGLLLSGRSVLPRSWGLEGTSIRMQMSVDNLSSLRNELERFRAEAHEFRQSSGKLEFLPPSVASRALSKDFAS